MVDVVEPVARAQNSAFSSNGHAQSSHTTAAAYYMQAVTDAIVLSAQARQVLNQIGQGQTVAEAWLSQFTQPPDLIKEAVQAAAQATPGANGEADTQASMQSAMKRTMGDLSWLFDAMSPPKVDTAQVAKVLAERMAANAVGTNPPLPQIVAQAEQAGTVPALYVENLSVTTGIGGTTASVDRVTLTTIDPTLARSTTTADGKPVVLDVGGEAGKVATQVLPGQPGDPQTDPVAAKAEEARQRALLIIRQGGQALPEGTLKVKLDALLPL